MSDEKNEYLGDGVYASYDGFNIWLAVNNHENKVIALEPEVFDELCQYVERINAENRARFAEAQSL